MSAAVWLSDQPELRLGRQACLPNLTLTVMLALPTTM